jgi:hypothetical protein
MVRLPDQCSADRLLTFPFLIFLSVSTDQLDKADGPAHPGGVPHLTTLCTSITPPHTPENGTAGCSLSSAKVWPVPTRMQGKLNECSDCRDTWHGCALSIDRAAAASSPQQTKILSPTTTTILATPASSSASMGFNDPLIVRRRTRCVPPGPGFARALDLVQVSRLGIRTKRHH